MSTTTNKNIYRIIFSFLFILAASCSQLDEAQRQLSGKKKSNDGDASLANGGNGNGNGNNANNAANNPKKPTAPIGDPTTYGTLECGFLKAGASCHDFKLLEDCMASSCQEPLKPSIKYCYMKQFNAECQAVGLKFPYVSCKLPNDGKGVATGMHKTGFVECIDPMIGNP